MRRGTVQIPAPGSWGIRAVQCRGEAWQHGLGWQKAQEIIAMLLCFQSGLPNSSKSHSERFCIQFHYQRNLPGCWVFELNECFPLILPLPPARSYGLFLVLWIKLGKKLTENEISHAKQDTVSKSPLWSGAKDVRWLGKLASTLVTM